MKRNAIIVLSILVSVLLSGCCMHDWQDATCTEPKTCAKCGETDGEEIGHDYSELTCTEDSVCSICGHVVENAKGHDYVGCVCSVCGEVEAPNFYSISRKIDESVFCSCGETYLLLDSNPNDDYPLSEEQEIEQLRCISEIWGVNDALHIPDSLDEKICRTSMLDGKQSETHGIIKTTWSYSDYKGVEIMWELCQ